jgi:hypothetical protein
VRRDLGLTVEDAPPRAGGARAAGSERPAGAERAANAERAAGTEREASGGDALEQAE